MLAEEQLNPSSSEILDDPSCVSRVATPIISRRGDEKKKGRGEKDHERDEESRRVVGSSSSSCWMRSWISWRDDDDDRKRKRWA